jgi:NADP-dependent aldehyde dehydrogenase
LSTVQGVRQELGEALVDADAVCAVGFTGSAPAGRALYDRGTRRARPIPVFAEMGSVNPAVLTRAALVARADEIRDALLAAVSGASGQLCTKPGVAFVPDGPEGDGFVDELVSELEQAPAGAMLNARLRDGFREGLERIGHQPGVQRLTSQATNGEPGFRQRAAAFLVSRPVARQRRRGR